jgi:hypothetical protein
MLKIVGTAEKKVGRSALDDAEEGARVEPFRDDHAGTDR